MIGLSFNHVTVPQLRDFLKQYDYLVGECEEDYLLTADTLSDLYDICHIISFDRQDIGYLVVDKQNKHYLKRLWVDDKYRKRGIGKVALQTFQIERLYCLIQNMEGRSFYEYLGFIPHSTHLGRTVLYKKCTL